MTILTESRRLATSTLVCVLIAPWKALDGTARKVLLAIVVLDVPLRLDTNIAHRSAAAELGGISGFNLSATTIAVALLYAGWLVEHVVHRSRTRAFPWRTTLPLVFYLLTVAFSVLIARDTGLAMRELFLLLQMFAVFVYIVAGVRTRRDVCFVVTVMVAGLLIESLVIIGLSAAGETVSFGGITGRVDAPIDGDDQLRVGGTTGAPNAAAAYLTMVLAPALAVLMTPMGRWHKVLAAVALTLGCVALLPTGSRGGWMAAVISIGLACASLWRHGRLRAAVPVLLLSVAIAVGVLFGRTMTDRLFGDDKGSARSRLPLMGIAANVIRENPVLGLGANNFTVALERHGPTLAAEWLYTVHNKYLLVWAETGLAGLAAFLWFLTTVTRNGWRLWRQMDPLLSPLALGLTAAVIGQTMHMHVDLFSERPQVQMLWLVAGLISAMRRI